MIPAFRRMLAATVAPVRRDPSILATKSRASCRTPKRTRSNVIRGQRPNRSPTLCGRLHAAICWGVESLQVGKAKSPSSQHRQRGQDLRQCVGIDSQQLALFETRPVRIPSSTARSSAVVSLFGQKEPITLTVNESKEFAKWFRGWIPAIRQNRALVEHIPPEKTFSTHGQDDSDGAHSFRPKRRAPCDRHII